MTSSKEPSFCHGYQFDVAVNQLPGYGQMVPNRARGVKRSSKPFGEGLAQQGCNDGFEGLPSFGIDLDGTVAFHELFTPPSLSGIYVR
jgi:hypothetical protein